jgi:ribosomal protein L5
MGTLVPTTSLENGALRGSGKALAFQFSPRSPSSSQSIAVSGANNVNAQAALNQKMCALQKVQIIAVRTQELSDGRIRYYTAERPSKTPGPTRGRSQVTEFNLNARFVLGVGVTITKERLIEFIQKC